MQRYTVCVMRMGTRRLMCLSHAQFGTTSLGLAAQSGELECVRFLLDQSANIEADKIVRRDGQGRIMGKQEDGVDRCLCESCISVCMLKCALFLSVPGCALIVSALEALCCFIVYQFREGTGRVQKGV